MQSTEVEGVSIATTVLMLASVAAFEAVVILASYREKQATNYGNQCKNRHDGYLVNRALGFSGLENRGVGRKVSVHGVRGRGFLSYFLVPGAAFRPLLGFPLF